MGGAKSKFESTDWIRANGKLSSEQRDPTIDGSPPTSSYGVYYLTKTKLNQREFTITDLEQNLLYTTKVVSGTLCWFDVYGSGIDDCRLRIQVDISRRFWVVYRMGIPCFKGQFADRIATDKLANDRRENGDDLTATPFLFRRCCIAVSWSRYMAVAMQYGPPEGIDVAKTAELMDDSLAAPMRKRGSEGSLVPLLQQQEKQRSKDSADDNNDDNSSEEKKAEEPNPANEEEDPSEEEDDDNGQSMPSKLVFDASMESASSLHGGSAASSSGADEPEGSQPITDVVSTWVQEQIQYIKDNKKKKLMSDPLEGLISFDKQLLLCQEIYDKIIGNHQTSVLSREHAIELLREDLEQHKYDGEIDGNNHPFLADQDGIFAHIEELKRLEDEEKKAKEANNNPQPRQEEEEEEHVASEEPISSQSDAHNDNIHQQEGKDQGRETKQEVEEESNQQTKQKHQKGESQDETAQSENQQSNWLSWIGKKEETEAKREVEEESDQQTNQKHQKGKSQHETAQLENQQSNWLSWIGKQEENERTEQNCVTDTTAPEGTASHPSSSSAEDDLVAYWLWENTWTAGGFGKTPQMKMHLAAGSDLALHVVMAIIVNQVRYERNAIAMTI